MKILIHGAVSSSNFGDCLYAQIYSEYIKNIDEDIDVVFWKNRLYGASRHVRKLCDSQVADSIEEIDGLVYMAGGYFSQQDDPYRRIKQYFELGERCLKLNKNIVISSVGGEVVKDECFSDVVAPIVKKASLVSVRNEKTFNTFKTHFGVEPVRLFDVILQVKKMNLSNLPSDLLKEIEYYKQQGKKIIFLHVHGRDKHNFVFEQKVIPALNKFIQNKNVHVIIGTDYIPRIVHKKISRLNIYKKIDGEKTAYTYKTPLELCALLKLCDIVVTPKLHVGVVAAAFEKSVLSFALNYTKTSEFYSEIGCSERCISLAEANDISVLENLEKFSHVPINIPNELFELSGKNLKLLKDAILKAK